MLSRPFLEVRDIAELLKTSEATVRNWIRSGDLCAVNLGREWRVAPRDLEEFLQRHSNRGPAGSAASATAHPDQASRDAV